jgi:PadR family transcriptional regulator PadR
MAKNTQMLKGVLEGCILEIVSIEEIYGYKICERLNEIGFDDVDDGSIYPILIRLEKKKFIFSIKKDSPLGPKRKYYYLTEEGKCKLSEFRKEWLNLREIVDQLIQKEGVGDED